MSLVIDLIIKINPDTRKKKEREKDDPAKKRRALHKRDKYTKNRTERPNNFKHEDVTVHRKRGVT